MIGRKFGKWKVIEEAGRNSSGSILWLCVCECGTKRKQQGGSLRFGSTKGCGCGHKTNYKHGMTNSRLYKIWRGMKERCHRKKHPGYKNYGDRSIGVCDSWLSFLGFKEDMEKSYNEHVQKFGEKNTTLDRIDNDGGYSRDNCKWSTLKEQHNNTRRSVQFTVNGITKSITDWAKDLRMSQNTIRKRIKMGVPIEEILRRKKI